MWIVKNEAAESLPLPELGVEIASKEYLDLDANGRDRAERSESVRSAVARSVLRTISKSMPAQAETRAKAPAGAPQTPVSAPGVLRGLADNPPIPQPLMIQAGAPSGAACATAEKAGFG